MKIIEIFSLSDESMLLDKEIIGSSCVKAKMVKALLINEHLSGGNPEGWAKRYEAVI